MAAHSNRSRSGACLLMCGLDTHELKRIIDFTAHSPTHTQNTMAAQRQPHNKTPPIPKREGRDMQRLPVPLAGVVSQPARGHSVRGSAAQCEVSSLNPPLLSRRNSPLSGLLLPCLGSRRCRLQGSSRSSTSMAISEVVLGRCPLWGPYSVDSPLPAHAYLGAQRSF